MISKFDYAVLSALVYNNSRDQKNKLTNPTIEGWSSIATPTNPYSGFTAEAYRNGNDIVISFKGTDTSDPVQFVLDAAADLNLGAGATSDQLKQAALFYAKIKSDSQFQGCNISFTGHSLGGGLASIMSVWFNLPATTFAEAPFELAALNPNTMTSIQTYLTFHGYGNFASQLSYTDLVLNYSARQSQVTNYYVQGEALQNLRTLWPTVLGGDNTITIGGASLLPGSALDNAITLHSMNLHAALLMSQTFDNDTVLLPKLLAEIFDTNLYAVSNLFAPQRDFLTSLLNDQIRVGYANADGLLARFAVDLDKLTQYSANLKDGALGKALIDVGIADYYFMQSGFSGKDFFNTLGGGISFDLTDIGANWSSNRATARLDTAIITQLLNGDQTARLFLAQDNYWSIQSGADTLNATGVGTNNDAMIGGATADALDGGSGNDFLFGGDGADTLTGGTGSDQLLGGAGNDTLNGGTGYDTYTLEGRDTIRDSDGNGILKDKAGNTLTGVIEKRADGTYAYLSDPSVSVTLDASLTLTLTLADGTIAVIENFTSGNLGLHLAETPTASPQGINGQEPLTGSNTLNSPNPAAPIIPLTQYNDRYWGIPDGLGLFQGLGGDDQLYAEDPTDPSTGTARPIATLIRNGNTQADSAQAGIFLYGNTGNDILVGSARRDELYGGAGQDLLIGGAGNDTLEGDAEFFLHDPALNAQDATPETSASDAIYAGNGDDTASGGKGNDIVYGEGGNDTLYGDDSGLKITDSNGIAMPLPETLHGNDFLSGGDGNDTLYGGAGDDLIYGDSLAQLVPGNDYLDGGDGNDTLYGNAGDDTVLGGAGDDKLYGGEGANYLDGGNGNDILNSGGPGSSLYGGAGDDNIFAAGGGNYLDGEDGADTLLADGGNNELFGGAGNDTLSATGGGNTLDGGAGTNSLIADGGNNTLLSGAGNDYLSSSGGRSSINGGDGNDTLVANMGNNTLTGGAGDDTLSATGGNNTLDGGDGADNLVAAGSGNTLYGGAGDDTLIAHGGGNTLNGGDGRDLYVFDAGFGTDHLVDTGGNGIQFNFSFAGSGIIVGLGSLKLSFTTGDVLHIDNFDPNDPTGTCSINTFQFSDRTLSLQDILDIGGPAVNPATGPDITGTANDDVMQGTNRAEHIYALAGNDIINAAGADTSLTEGGVNDYMRGYTFDIMATDVANDEQYRRMA